MKVKIQFKNDNSGVKNNKSWRILSLLCSVDTSEDANLIAMHGVKCGVPMESISKLIKPNEYNGVTTYQFKIIVSLFTFERVSRFGILDIDLDNLVITFDGNFANTKILVVDKKEQINGYEEPEDDVTGWKNKAPEAKAPEPMGDGSMGEQLPITDFSALPNSGQAGADLPF